jgi:hypothetical protein
MYSLWEAPSSKTDLENLVQLPMCRVAQNARETPFLPISIGCQVM